MPVCTASDFSGTPNAVSVYYLYESAVGGAPPPVWKLEHRGPSVQDPKARGRDWMAQDPYVPPTADPCWVPVETIEVIDQTRRLADDRLERIGARVPRRPQR